MKKLITLTLFAIGLVSSGSTVFANNKDEQSNASQEEKRPRTKLDEVKEKLKSNMEQEQQNRDDALQQDLPSNNQK